MCLQPVYLKRKDVVTGRLVERCVPCGVCPECLKKRQSAIVVRSVIEATKRPRLWMFTLTYKPEKLPCTEDGEVSLRREDIKNWKKDFRRSVSSDFAWICCGEYSPKGDHRPHYHGLIFGLDRSEINILDKSWSDKYGFTVFKPVSVASSEDVGRVCRYVSKYVVKDVAFRAPSSDVEQPRMMSSIGFGYPDKRYLDWITCKDLFDYDPFDSSTISMEIVLRVMDRMHYHFGGFNYSVPLYILRKFLYEKNLKGNLSPCALLKMVSFVKRFRNQRVSYESFKSFQALFSGRTYSQIVDEYNRVQELFASEKLDTQRKDFISTYKTSLI